MARKALDKALEKMIKEEQSKIIDSVTKHIKESIDDSDFDIDELISNFKEELTVNKTEEKGTKKKSEKKVTTRKPSNYNIFKKIRNAELQKENSDLSGKERIDMMNEEWKAKSASEKEKYKSEESEVEDEAQENSESE